MLTIFLVSFDRAGSHEARQENEKLGNAGENRRAAEGSGPVVKARHEDRYGQRGQGLVRRREKATGVRDRGTMEKYKCKRRKIDDLMRC